MSFLSKHIIIFSITKTSTKNTNGLKPQNVVFVSQCLIFSLKKMYKLFIFIYTNDEKTK